MSLVGPPLFALEWSMSRRGSAGTELGPEFTEALLGARFWETTRES